VVVSSSPALAASSTTTTLSSSPNPSAYGQAVTLKSEVESPTGLPTGSVGFRRGSESLAIAPALDRSHAGQAAAVGLTSDNRGKLLRLKGRAPSYHSCAIVSGFVSCWGLNNFGQLGMAGPPTATPP
jgi:hypothetical protein